MLREGGLRGDLMESRQRVAGGRGKALALGQNGRLGLRGLQRLALRHQLQGRRVC